MGSKLLLSPSLKVRQDEINNLLKSAKIALPHPDLWFLPKDSKLGIEQARKIKEFFFLKPYQAKGRVVVLEDGSGLTDEAQNALLKILEELPSQSLFILGANSEAYFLPTVLSRCEIIRLPNPPLPTAPESAEEYENDIRELLASSIPERFAYVEKLADKEGFFRSLLAFFQQNKNTLFLQSLLHSEQLMRQNVNIRAILEYLMLVMPSKK